MDHNINFFVVFRSMLQSFLVSAGWRCCKFSGGWFRKFSGVVIAYFHWGWYLIAQIITGVGKKVTGVVKILENLDGVGKKVIGVVKTHENLDGVGKKVTGVVKITEDLDGVHPGAPRCTPMHPGAPRCTPARAVMNGVLSVA